MRNPLALHHFTLFDISPFELVPIAAKTGCGAVCIFVNSPDDPAPGQNVERTAFPVVTRADMSRFKRLLTEYGVRVTNLEFFPLAAGTDAASFRDKLELGAELGARLAVTHIHDTDRDRALEKLIAFATVAAEFELCVGLEFMGLSPGCPTLIQAVEFVRRAKLGNVGIGVDAIHLHLTGGTAMDLRRVPPAYIAYAQVCDTNAPYDERVAASPERYLPLVFERSIPGRGMLPLKDFTQALPAGTFYDVEVPWPSRAAHGVSAEEHARRAVEAALDVCLPVTVRGGPDE